MRRTTRRMMKNATKARALIRHKEFVVRRVYRSVIGSATVSRCETYDKYLSRRFPIHR
jgi:hypothetical protein